jgi:cysteine synthase B
MRSIMGTVTAERVNSGMMERIIHLGRRIGNTPLLPVTRLFNRKGVKIYAKAEWEQLSGSVKARAAYHIIRAAVESGELPQGKTLLDATSGNTGIAYATLGRLLNIPVALCLPENASKERIAILKSSGAEIIYTSRFGGTDEAQEVAALLAEQNPEKYFYADQYKNDQNWKAHYDHTAIEILREQPGITHFVAGLGTTGTFTGNGRRLKEYNPNVQLIALQPDFALHGLEGWKHLETAKVPAIYDPGLAHRFLEISTEEAHRLIRDVFKLENVLLSPSSAANLAGAIRVAEELEEGVVVTVLPDNADKYSEVIMQLV